MIEDIYAFLSLHSHNMTLALLALGTAASVLAAYLGSRRHAGTEPPLPPGPRGLEALRVMLRALREGSFVRPAREWSRRYGEVALCRSVLGDLCVLSSARLVRQLYAGKDTEHLTNNRPNTFCGKFLLYGNKDVITSGPAFNPHWAAMRKMIHTAFKFYGDGVERMESRVQAELQRLVTELEGCCGHDTEVYPFLSESVMRAVTALATGECNDASVIAKIRRFDEVSNELFSPATEAVMSVFPWVRFLPCLRYRQLFRDNIQAREEAMEGMFHQPKATHTRGEPRGIVDVLLDEQGKGENRWLTDDHIKGILINTFGAAFLTTTQALSAAFLYLTHYPKVASRLQQQIDERIGDRMPRLQDRGRLPYVQAVVLETLRLASPVAMGLPHIIDDDVILEGYTIPQGTTVFANTLVFHRDPEIFPDPEEFRPERFLDDEGQLVQATHPTRQRILPFGVGKRLCAGESFAKSRVFLYVATLFQKLDFLPPTEHELLDICPSSWRSGIVPQLRPLHVRLRAR